MSRARPGRARATTAAPSNLPPAGDNRAVPLRSCSFFVPLAAARRPPGTLALAASPGACGSATPRRPRLRWPFWPTSAAPPFLTHSSSSHFRVAAENGIPTAKKRQRVQRPHFQHIAVVFAQNRTILGGKSHKIIEKNGKKFCSLGLLCLLLHQIAAKKRQSECVKTNRNGNSQANHTANAVKRHITNELNNNKHINS